MSIDILTCGEGGIRTPGTPYEVRQFSKLLVSATHPPIREISERGANIKLIFHTAKKKKPN